MCVASAALPPLPNRAPCRRRRGCLDDRSAAARRRRRRSPGRGAAATDLARSRGSPLRERRRRQPCDPPGPQPARLEGELVDLSRPSRCIRVRHPCLRRGAVEQHVAAAARAGHLAAERARARAPQRRSRRSASFVIRGRHPLLRLQAFAAARRSRRAGAAAGRSSSRRPAPSARAARDRVLVAPFVARGLVIDDLVALAGPARVDEQHVVLELEDHVRARSAAG